MFRTRKYLLFGHINSRWKSVSSYKCAIYGPSEERARLSIRMHSFQKKICRINARNHLARLSALATTGPFVLLLTSQYESGAYA
jgi:hypothetical protein